jgi:uncharacterized membrane protein YfcA
VPLFPRKAAPQPVSAAFKLCIAPALVALLLAAIGAVAAGAASGAFERIAAALLWALLDPASDLLARGRRPSRHRRRRRDRPVHGGICQWAFRLRLLRVAGRARNNARPNGMPMPVIYLGRRRASKIQMRGITLPYILAMQLASLSTLAGTNTAIFNTEFWLLWALTLPSVLLGSSAGVALYRRMSDVNFHRAVLGLLPICGISLVLKTLI